MGQALSIADLKKRRKIFRSDSRLKEALLDLKETVENVADSPPDVALRGGIYKELVEADLLTVTLNNLEVGYKVIRNSKEEFTELRRVFVTLHGFHFDELPDEDKDPLMAAIFDVFLTKDSDVPDVEAPDASTVIFTQLCVRPGVLAGKVIQ